MKILKERTEIAQALNFNKYPVMELDLNNVDEYGILGSKCRIDMGNFNDGSPWYQDAELRVYSDEKKVCFSAGACFLSNDWTYNDVIEDMSNAMTPIIKPNSEFALVIHDSATRKVYGVAIIETLGVHRLCTQPLNIETVDMSMLMNIAREHYEEKYKERLANGSALKWRVA